jgi:hypothetical protein
MAMVASVEAGLRRGLGAGGTKGAGLLSMGERTLPAAVEACDRMTFACRHSLCQTMIDFHFAVVQSGKNRGQHSTKTEMSASFIFARRWDGNKSFMVSWALGRCSNEAIQVVGGEQACETWRGSGHRRMARSWAGRRD